MINKDDPTSAPPAINPEHCDGPCFGEVLRNIRTARGYDQRTFGEFIGYAGQSISHIEKCNKLPRMLQDIELIRTHPRIKCSDEEWVQLVNAYACDLLKRRGIL